jgi:hypothetical protein
MPSNIYSHTCTMATLEIMNTMDLRYAPYRFGWPYLLAMPVKDHDANRYARESVSLPYLHRIDEILHENMLQRARRCLTIRVHQGEASQGTTLTSLVIAKIQNRPLHEIAKTIDGLREILKGTLPECLIELIDEDWEQDFTTGAIHPSETWATKLWESRHKDVVIFLEKIKKEQGLRWTNWRLFHRGTSEERQGCPVTLLIGTPNADEDYWAKEAYQAMRLLAKSQFAVEASYSSGWTIVSDDAISMKAYDPQLRTDASFGPMGIKGGGALGGF